MLRSNPSCRRKSFQQQIYWLQNRAEAERTVKEWIVTGNIPVRVGSKGSKVKRIDKIRLFNDLRTAEFDSDDINNIIKILKERNYLYSAVASTSKCSIPIEDFLENLWDYDKSPYVREKLGKKQSIHRQYCATLLSRIRLYWIPRLAGKCVAEITRKDVDAFFSSDEAKIANELAMHTGMCAGEIQALTVDDLGEDVIYVRRSWSKYDDLKCCKNGEESFVIALSGHKTEGMLNHYGTHLEDDKVVELARNVMKKVFIDQKEDEETIKKLNQKLEELNKAIA